jgi:hypothetical protein
MAWATTSALRAQCWASWCSGSVGARATKRLELNSGQPTGAELGALEAHVAVAPAALSVGALGAAARSRMLWPEAIRAVLETTVPSSGS